MPSGTAQRPGDVVTMRNGTTVEILDTDAEGRMVLGDGICLAGEAKPDAIVDIATLTGAQMVALGSRVAGIMANDDTFRDRVRAAADAAGEAAWPMPLPEDLRAQLDSPVADIAHKGERWGGMLTAGLFLKEFVAEGTPWAHVDIAGPSFNEGSPWGYTPKGGTGYRRRHPARAGRGLRRLTGTGSARAAVQPEPSPARRWQRGPSDGRTVPPVQHRCGVLSWRWSVSRRSCGGTSAASRWSRRPGRGRPCRARGSSDTSRAPVRLLLVQRLAELALHLLAGSGAALRLPVSGLGHGVSCSVRTVGRPDHPRTPRAAGTTCLAGGAAAQPFAALARVPLAHPVRVARLEDVVDRDPEAARERRTRTAATPAARRVHSPSCAMRMTVVAVTLVGGST